MVGALPARRRKRAQGDADVEEVLNEAPPPATKPAGRPANGRYDAGLRYIALGANLEDPVAQVRAAFAALATLPDTRFDAVSSFYSNPAVGYADQADSMIPVAEVETALTRSCSMRCWRSNGASAACASPNAPRTLDLDMVVYGRKLSMNPSSPSHIRACTSALGAGALRGDRAKIVVPGQGPVRALVRSVDTGSLTKVVEQP